MTKYQENYLNNRQVFSIGNEALLQKKKIGIFVSRVIPLDIIVPAEKLLLSLCKLPYVFIGGWHSPFERRILKKILTQNKEAIFFTAKGIKNQSQYKYLKKAIDEGRLLIISLLKEKAQITLHNSLVRNKLIGDISEQNLFIFINKNGNLENLFNQLLSQGKTPLIFNHEANSAFLKRGRAIGIDNFKEVLL